MELSDLVGEHYLDAVDDEYEKQERSWGYPETVSVLYFRLDDTVYGAVEDPDDGYRSHMQELITSDREMINEFSPQKVIGQYSDNGSEDILRLIDAETGKVVLEVGTNYCDDYYPCFVASFHPEAMAINKGR